MFFEIQNAIGEVCHWVGGVTACTTQGLVAGAITGAAMGGGLGYSSDLFTGSKAIPGAILGALFGAAAGAVTCGLTRVFSEDAGRKITTAAWGAAWSSVFSIGIPIVSQMAALVSADAGWQIKSEEIANENRRMHALLRHNFLFKPVKLFC